MKRLLVSIGVSIGLLIAPAGALASFSNSGSSFAYCNGDYVIPGGVSSTSGVVDAYSHPRVSHVYNYFGITSDDMSNFSSQAQSGTVYKNGEVRLADGKLVATSAMTAGCQNISGSNTVSDGYMTFYTRPTSVSFASSALHAYVVMKNGQFAYAILTSCGNPVKATPVAAPAPKVKSATTTKTTTTTPPVQTQTQTQTQTIVVNQQAPPAQPATTTTTTTQTQPAPAAKALPNTGAGGVAGLAVISTVLGTIGHFIYSRRHLFN